MIGIALNLASRIVSGPRAQKVMAYLILAAAACLILWLVYLLFASWVQSGKDEAVATDRREATLDAITIQRDADNAAAHFQQGAELDRQRGYDNAMEAINASISDPDGDALAATLDRMR